MSLLERVINQERAKGQAALEYMVVISFAFLLAAPLLLNAQRSARELRTSSRLSLARNSLNTIEDAARIVHSQGSPARLSFTIRVPSRVTKANVSGRQVKMRLEAYGGVTDVYSLLDFNVSGSLPTAQGRYKMQAKAEDNYVNISQSS